MPRHTGDKHLFPRIKQKPSDPALVEKWKDRVASGTAESYCNEIIATENIPDTLLKVLAGAPVVPIHLLSLSPAKLTKAIKKSNDL